MLESREENDEQRRLAGHDDSDFSLRRAEQTANHGTHLIIGRARRSARAAFEIPLQSRCSPSMANGARGATRPTSPTYQRAFGFCCARRGRKHARSIGVKKDESSEPPARNPINCDGTGRSETNVARVRPQSFCMLRLRSASAARDGLCICTPNPCC